MKSENELSCMFSCPTSLGPLVQRGLAPRSGDWGIVLLSFRRIHKSKVCINNPSPASRELPLHKGAFFVRANCVFNFPQTLFSLSAHIACLIAPATPLFSLSAHSLQILSVYTLHRFLNPPSKPPLCKGRWVLRSKTRRDCSYYHLAGFTNQKFA